MRVARTALYLYTSTNRINVGAQTQTPGNTSSLSPLGLNATQRYLNLPIVMDGFTTSLGSVSNTWSTVIHKEKFSPLYQIIILK